MGVKGCLCICLGYTAPVQEHARNPPALGRSPRKAPCRSPSGGSLCSRCFPGVMHANLQPSGTCQGWAEAGASECEPGGSEEWNGCLPRAIMALASGQGSPQAACNPRALQTSMGVLGLSRVGWHSQIKVCINLSAWTWSLLFASSVPPTSCLCCSYRSTGLGGGGGGVS